MNIYIVFSYKDKTIVSQYLKKIKDDVEDFNPCILDDGWLWKIKAQEYIKNANFVLFFCGDSSYISNSIGWELRTAQKYRKRVYTILLSKENILHDELYKIDDYSGIKRKYNNIIKPNDIKHIIENYKNEDYGLLNLVGDELETHYETLLEQYKIYVQTSETLVERRQKANTYYLSVNSCLVTVYSLFITLVKSRVFSIGVSVIITLLGVVLCTSWVKAIQTYGNLNSGKFKVINTLERKLPANMFDAEWKALSDQLNNQRYISFTKSEQDVPKIFIMAYILLFVVSVIASTKTGIKILSPLKDLLI